MSRIREAAENQACFIRIPGVCNWNPETTVHAHLNGYAMGKKMPDLLGCPACSACHEQVDKYRRIDPDDLPLDARAMFYFFQGIVRWQQLALHEGLIKTPGSK